MHVLITGAGGFIGKSVVRKARERGWMVTGIARRPCDEASVIADLRQPMELRENPDAVIHLAGGYAGERFKALAATDVPIAQNLIAWAKKAGVRRCVFASAAEVYGDVEGVADENYPCRPVIPYGSVKLRVENMFRQAGIPELTICRVGEVYGSEGRILHELGGKLRNGFCPWAGDGRVKISFVHVDDVAEALLRACQHSRPGVELYNVGDNEPATWRQFLDEIASHFGVRGAFYLPTPISYGYAALLSWGDRLLGRPANITPQVLRLLITPKVLSSERLGRQVGFVPKYPSISSGLPEVLSKLSH